jgi:hypothetical protein
VSFKHNEALKALWLLYVTPAATLRNLAYCHIVYLYIFSMAAKIKIDDLPEKHKLVGFIMDMQCVLCVGENEVIYNADKHQF